MRRLRSVRKLWAMFCVLSGAALSGCGADPGAGAGPEANGRAALEVAHVTTVTTLQASSGVFLSPSPRQAVPAYVNRGEPAPQRSTDGSDRARVDIAVLFRSSSSGEAPLFEAGLAPRGAWEWSPVEHDFPSVTSTADGARWKIQPFRGADNESDGISSEWSGWQVFGGLRVRSPAAGGGEDASAAVATLDFEVHGARSPLVLTLSDSQELVVTNQSDVTVERALLIYSHSGGVAVTALNTFGPGARRITTLGPKERPPEQLLERGRAALADFFSPSVGADLAKALAEAKSIPFLETHGFRLISLLTEDQAPAQWALSTPVASRRQVVVSHSEILKLEEEARVLSVVADPALDIERVTGELGRFSEGKLEFAAGSTDTTVSTRALGLLGQLRSQ